jgi:putative ABC transport system ATP-binding protein
MKSPVVACNNLKFQYPRQGFGLSVPCFQLNAGQTVFLQGDSGSGKSTFLSILAGVLRPQHGEVVLMGQSLQRVSTSRCDKLRVDHMGFLFQQFNLLNYLSVLENVCLPCQFSSVRLQRALKEHASLRQAATRLLDTLGLSPWIDQPVSALSVGQQQRVAAARALIGQPDLVIADEPTSALDESHRDQFMRLLLSLVQERNMALMFVSHDLRLTSYFDLHQCVSDWHLNPVDV